MTEFRTPWKGNRAHRLSRELKQALDEATEMVGAGEYDAAYTQLVHLADRYPRSEPVLNALINVSFERRDWEAVTRYSEQVLPLQRSQERALTLNNLVSGYTILGYPGLVWHTAQKMIERYPDFPEIDEVKSLVRSTKRFLLEEVDMAKGATDLAPDEWLDMAVQHDRVRYYTESGQPERAIEAAEALLEKLPTFVPVLNNLSLAYFAGGALHKAVATAERVLTLAPENFHALANLTRFSFLAGRFDEAEQYAARLKQLRGANMELNVKQAEALSYLGDDEGVRDAYQRAKEGPDDLPALLLHLGAAAHFRLGDEKMGWRLWRRAVRRDPSFALADQCLDDWGAPAGERNTPWYWPLPYWWSGDLDQEIRELAQAFDGPEENSDDDLVNAIRSMLAAHPALPQLLPHILERGNGWARRFIVNVIRAAEQPDLWPILYDFAVGRYGTDALRLDAIHILRDKAPALLPADGMVTMWVQGEQQELFLVSFDIHNEPQPVDDVPAAILEQHEKAYHLLEEGDAEEAAPLLEEIVAAAPDFPPPYHQLSVAYERQGRHEEAQKLIEETYARFPDYLFARVAMARHHIQNGRSEEAIPLLDPLLRRDRLHISEFRALADAQIALARAQGREEVAQGWLEMWEGVDGGHPRLAHWHARLQGPESVAQMLVDRLPKRTADD